MASSSSSAAASSQSPNKYDVFISFRGEDTRNNFTSHLHHALCRNQIDTYIDYRLEKGDEVWPSLVKAIEDSTLFLIIFSENYASSTWCLNELTKIIECSKDQGHCVIPVFYGIEPSHVRKQEGSYEIAFSKHEYTNHNQQIQKWKDALTQSANLSGWHCDAERNEAELIRVIIKGVLIKLDSMHQSDYSNSFMGINQQMAHIESLLCYEVQDVRFIGIWGMGGIGKTTIATALFNKLCFAFESSCFFANVREEWDKFGISHLKKKLISILLEDNESYMGYAWPGGSTCVQRRLSRKKMLVVLDDVNDPEQLKILVGSHHCFGQGSRVIITTRDKQVLAKDVDDIYEVQALDFHVALQLFCLNAFKHNFLDKEFEELSWKVVAYAQGIPLALIVLGVFLCGKSKEEWESQLKKMRKMPPKKVQQILKLSYDALDYEEKNIFLSIACFFKGKGIKAEQVKILLDACGYSTSIGLKSLQDKALITISHTKNVFMHDLIQEMGQQIVREESLEDPSKRSWLWNPDDIYEILKDNKGSEGIKGMTLNMSKIGRLKLSPQVFVKMSKLKFLNFYNSPGKEHSLYLPRGLKYLTNEVRYLHWVNYPLKSLPLTFCAENLVDLNMRDSNIQKLWDGVQNVANLNRIDLSYSKHLKELPDFSKALHLERINLGCCVSLPKVHPSILSLNSLKNLVLLGCHSLTSLKSDTHLRSLIFVNVADCSSLKEFSITSENMKHLDLGGTAINVLPSSIVCLSKLKRLILSGCKSLKNIPINLLGGLRCLKGIWMRCCNVLELPDDIKHLSNLEYLSLERCTRLQYLPELPPSLRYLYADDCSSLEAVQFTSIAEETYIPQKTYFSFKNCFKLDQHSIKAIQANELVKINKLLSQLGNLDYKPTYRANDQYGFRVVYPGSRVPEWFKYRTTHATSITIDLSSAPFSMDWGIIFCFVLPPFSSMESFSVNWKTDHQPVSIYAGSAFNLPSDHVFLCYKPLSGCYIYPNFENRATSNAEVNFFCQIWSEDSQRHEIEIKEFGICPSYCSKYWNFIKQMKLESQTSASRMGIGCSDEGETRSPTHSIACLADRRPPQPLRTYYRKRKRVDQVNPSQDLHVVHTPHD